MKGDSGVNVRRVQRERGLKKGTACLFTLAELVSGTKAIREARGMLEKKSRWERAESISTQTQRTHERTE